MSGSPFGDMLKTFRKRQRLSQQALATRLGVHRNTIWSWEQGNYLPDSKGMVLELARQLGLSGAEERQFLEASLTALSAHWSVPYRRNPFFTGREHILHHLHESLATRKEAALVPASALHGLGGIGKTQTALEYAYRYAQHYAAIFWIEAETSEGISASFLRIAEQLGLTGAQEADHAQIVAAVQRWLASHRDWLLIWDNVEDLEILQRWLPPTRQGALLFTTRRQTLGALARGIELPTMTLEEGTLFVLRRANVLPPEASNEHVQQVLQERPGAYTTAQQLVIALGGLPLALDQAGAYVEETPCRLEDYLDLYQLRRADLLKRRGDAVLDHPASVVTTWSLSFEHMEHVNGAAADLLRLCAVLHPDAIPEELFSGGAALLGERLGNTAADPFQLHAAFQAVSAYSLLKHQVEARTLSIHRLVQAVLWEQMSEQEREVWLWRAIRALNAAFPEITHHVWSQCERLLPHVLACAAALPDDACDPDLAEVLRKAADYLRGRARFAQPEPLYQRAVRIEEQMAGPDHLRLAAPLYGLSLLYWDQGKYTQAEPLCQRALSIWEQVLGPEHPELARPVNGLALIFFKQGKYAQAEPLYQRALRIREQALGREHPLVVTPLSNLGDLYIEQGKYAQAEPLYLRAIRIQEQAAEGERPQLAYPLSGLARLYTRQGKDAQAEPLYQRALQIRERELGVEHPYVAEPLIGLAIISSNRGQYAQAEALLQRALRLCEQALGPQHPEVAAPLTHLADLYTAQGQYTRAAALYHRALSIREHCLGRHHPETAQTRLDCTPSLEAVD
ncbi:MAG TPA: FxSxx-COOH system tetratricopeptide repeat protein [Ktedonobacterales bacterium]|nr:FxSxx-COOH system tetratricopeptide repeat protein [Ktedonobacterales bacterium]